MKVIVAKRQLKSWWKPSIEKMHQVWWQLSALLVVNSASCVGNHTRAEQGWIDGTLLFFLQNGVNKSVKASLLVA